MHPLNNINVCVLLEGIHTIVVVDARLPGDIKCGMQL